MAAESEPLFLLGAGFNADAKAEVGPVWGQSIYVGRHEIACSYPLVGDLAHLCFGLAGPPGNESIEELFQRAWESRDFEPIQRLTHALMKADYFLAEGLIPMFGATPNSYSTFFARFAGSSFLTFNYDSLPELFLLRQDRWYPHDGYGVPVDAEVMPGHEHLRECSSGSLVLHLHGSLCLYTSTSTFVQAPREQIAWHTQRERPQYLFDPHSIATLFSPFKQAPMVLGYHPPERRIVAPVPDKAEGLRKEFITAVYARATELVAASDAPVIAIGYSFDEHDRASYHPILSAVAKKAAARVVLVLPEAQVLKRRMQSEYPGISWSAEARTFTAWANAGFPIVSDPSERAV